MSYKITSSDLKLALLHYYRFNYGYVCADEFQGADIIVDTGSEVIEVEVKVDKSDLIEGEKAKARKHLAYVRGNSYNKNHPNKFLFCVPEYMIPTTLDWATRMNINYGVIGFDTDRFQRGIQKNFISWTNNNCYLRIARSAKKLHEKYDDKLRWLISKRVVSQATNLMTEKFLYRLRKIK